jgi:hypothetical protein
MANMSVAPREELRLMRSRFLIPPYMFAELDAHLRNG